MSKEKVIDLPLLINFLNDCDTAEKFQQRLDLLSEEELAELAQQLNYSTKCLQSNIGKTLFNRLYLYHPLTAEQIEKLKIKKREYAASILRIVAVMWTSLVGFSTGLVSLANFSPITNAILYPLIAASAALSTTAMCVLGKKRLRKDEKNAISQCVHLEVELKILKASNTKLQESTATMLRNVVAQLTRLNCSFTANELRRKIKSVEDDALIYPFKLFQEDFFNTREGILLLSDKLEQQFNSEFSQDYFDVTDTKKVHEHLANIKKLALKRLAFKELAEQINEQQQGDANANLGDLPNIKTFPRSLRVAEPTFPVSFSKWRKQNKRSSIETLLLSLVGSIAGNLVIPHFLLALAGTHLAKIAFFAALASFFSGPAGIVVMAVTAILLGVLIAYCALYSQYRSANRSDVLDTVKRKIDIEKSLQENFQRKLNHVKDLKEDLNQLEVVFKKKSELQALRAGNQRFHLAESPQQSQSPLNEQKSMEEKYRDTPVVTQELIEEQTFPSPQSQSTTVGKEFISISDSASKQNLLESTSSNDSVVEETLKRKPSCAIQ